MTTIEILEKREADVINLTIAKLSEAFNTSGMFKPSVAFFVNETQDGKIEVGYYHYVGNQCHSENVFWVVNGHEMPEPIDYGYDDFDEIDWYALDYENWISGKINQHVNEHYQIMA